MEPLILNRALPSLHGGGSLEIMLTIPIIILTSPHLYFGDYNSPNYPYLRNHQIILFEPNQRKFIIGVLKSNQKIEVPYKMNKDYM